jgi:alginate O-acetyltransferase complex protein AlgI
VFFRAKTFSRAWTVLRGMFGGNASPVPLLSTESLVVVAAIIAGLVVTHWLMRNRTLESVLARAPAAVLSCTWAVMAFAIIATQGNGNAFIYFQF